MSKLAELVKFKNELRDTINQLSLHDVIDEKLNIIKNLRLKHTLPQYDQDIDNFIGIYNEIVLKNQNNISNIEDTIQKIDNDIEQLLQSKQDEYKNRFVEGPNMSNFLSTNDAIENIICSRISAYNDWKYPGLQLHCRYFRPGNPQTSSGDRFVKPLHRINSMVGTDPLYLAGFDKFHLNEIISAYPAEYQRRLRLYEIKERNFSVLPHAQFGLILCWDFFNYITATDIDFYLKKITMLLRPGGVCIFSYNNCLKERSAQLVDEGLASWVTLPMIEALITGAGLNLIGFSDLESHDDNSTWVSWAEVQKPGELTSVKRSQSMGQVLSK